MSAESVTFCGMFHTRRWRVSRVIATIQSDLKDAHGICLLNLRQSRRLRGLISAQIIIIIITNAR